MEKLSAERWQQIAAINAKTYRMTPEERDQWFRDHPVSDFEMPEDD